MKDFNFFSSYLLEKRNRRQKKIYIVSVSSLLIIAILAFSALNYYQIVRYNDEISKVEGFLNSDNTKQLAANYEETKRNTELLTAYYNKVSEVDKFLNNYNTVSTELINNITSAMPKDSKLLSLTIKNGDVEMKYSVGGMISAAELEHNLKLLDIFEKVHVSVVDTNKISTAMISCSLKDVNKNEAETDK